MGPALVPASVYHCWSTTRDTTWHRGKQRRELDIHLMEYDLSPLLVGLEGAPEEHWMIVQEPAGEPAELPLPTDVGTCNTRSAPHQSDKQSVSTRTKYGEHILLLYHLEKPAQGAVHNSTRAR